MTTPAASLIAALLETLEALETAARYLHPPYLTDVAALLGRCDAMLRAASDADNNDWPDASAPLRDGIRQATEYCLRACDGLREAAATGDVRTAYRALRQPGRACEALYPVAPLLPEIGRIFLEPSVRDDNALLRRLSDGAKRTDISVGVMHFANSTDQRGGYSLYVPEDYDATRAYPLIMALHGGAGHGRLFLWTWLRTARSFGAILAAPTAMGDTWSLMEPDIDAAHLARVLADMRERWRIDPTRLLLTGMSDGGTFSLLSGLDASSPFTHLAPVAASFHPLLLTMAEPQHVMGLPIYLVHGALDWMFPVTVGRTAQRALTAAGARLTYREIADLSHTYPREENPKILDWLSTHSRGKA